MKFRLKKLTVDRVDLVDNPANPMADMALIYKRDSEEEPMPEETSEVTDEVEEVAAEATDETPVPTLEERIAALEAALTAEPVVEAEPVAASAEPVEEDVEKSDLRKSLEDAQAEIAKMKHEARVSEFIAKAKNDLPNLGTADEVGHMLLTIADVVPADTYQTLERTLKAANAQIGSGDLFKQIGDPGGTEPAEVTDRIYRLADELVEKGDAPNRGMALSAVLKQHPELRDEYYSATERA